MAKELYGRHPIFSEAVLFALVEKMRWCSSSTQVGVFSVKQTFQQLPVVQFSSVTQWCPNHCHPMDHSKTGLLPITNCPSLPKLMSIGRWCYPTVSSSVIPFSSCLQSFTASGSFPMSQRFISGDQSIGISASTSVLPMNTQDWSLLGWTDWISLQSKGLSRVFSNTTVQKHQFFGTQLSL